MCMYRRGRACIMRLVFTSAAESGSLRREGAPKLCYYDITGEDTTKWATWLLRTTVSRCPHTVGYGAKRAAPA